MKTLKSAAFAAALVVSAALAAPAFAQQPSPAEMQRGKEFLQKSMGMMKPELQEKARALPPEICHA